MQSNGPDELEVKFEVIGVSPLISGKAYPARVILSARPDEDLPPAKSFAISHPYGDLNLVCDNPDTENFFALGERYTLKLTRDSRQAGTNPANDQNVMNAWRGDNPVHTETPLPVRTAGDSLRIPAPIGPTDTLPAAPVAAVNAADTAHETAEASHLE